MIRFESFKGSVARSIVKKEDVVPAIFVLAHLGKLLDTLHPSLGRYVASLSKSVEHLITNMLIIFDIQDVFR